MRFLAYTIGDDSVPITPPTPELLAEMGTFMEEATRAGVLLETGGLTPSAQGVTVRYAPSASCGSQAVASPAFARSLKASSRRRRDTAPTPITRLAGLDGR